jgi:hypothetical protein
MKEPKDPYCRYASRSRPQESFCRHPSGRYALVFRPGTGPHVDLRVYDHWRYYVPRRLRAPLLTEAEIEQPENSDHPLRRRRLALFPGAAYDLVGKATGLRGSVTRDGETMRWAYVDAFSMDTFSLIGRARADDRGEFLLLIWPEAAPETDLSRTIPALVSISGPVEPPEPDSEDIPALDDLWDLPLEVLPGADTEDDVSSGESYPEGYAAAPASVLRVDFEIGRILTGIDVAPFDFLLP